MRELIRKTLFGAASSSCFLGAVSTAKSIFKKGPLRRPTPGTLKFAGNNLVIELVLIILN